MDSVTGRWSWQEAARGDRSVGRGGGRAVARRGGRVRRGGSPAVAGARTGQRFGGAAHARDSDPGVASRLVGRGRGAGRHRRSLRPGTAVLADRGATAQPGRRIASTALGLDAARVPGRPSRLPGGRDHRCPRDHDPGHLASGARAVPRDRAQGAARDEPVRAAVPRGSCRGRDPGRVRGREGFRRSECRSAQQSACVGGRDVRRHRQPVWHADRRADRQDPPGARPRRAATMSG